MQIQFMSSYKEDPICHQTTGVQTNQNIDQELHYYVYLEFQWQFF